MGNLKKTLKRAFLLIFIQVATVIAATVHIDASRQIEPS